MRIGIVSDSELFIPTGYALTASGLQVYIYYLPSPDLFANENARAFALQEGIPLTEEGVSDIDLYSWLTEGQFDLCFIMGYKHRIDLNRLPDFQTPLFNVHFGSLPSFRGPSPVFWQLKRGVEKLAVTIHRLTSRLDDGPVVWMKESENHSYFNHRLANQMLSRLCVEGIAYVLQMTMKQMPIPVIDRSHIPAAYQQRPVLADVMIDWQQMDAIEIGNLTRACNPWNKGAITFFHGKEMKLMDAVMINNGPTGNNPVSPGTIVTADQCLQVACIHGHTIKVNMIYYQECFIPTYYCKWLEIRKNDKLNNLSQ